MRLLHISAVLVLCLAAVSAAAQQGRTATGEGGCYFGACDTPNVDERDDRDRPDVSRVPDRSYTPPPPPPQGPQVCVTHFGSCQMAMRIPDGSSCTCPALANGMTAVGVTADQNRTSSTYPPNLASICQTLAGACQMGMQLGRNQSCFCPTAFGPIQGVSQ